MTTISLTIALFYTSICFTESCKATKVLNESVKIQHVVELDGFASFIQFKASNNAINSAVY